MKCKCYPLLLFLGILSGYSSPAQKLIFKTYTVENGLVANPVRKFYQDNKGFLWIATREGLSKYDGYKFTNFTIANGLSHNLVNDMYESADGKLYIAENNGTIDLVLNGSVVEKSKFSGVTVNNFCNIGNKTIIAATDSGGLQELKMGNLIKPMQSFPRASYIDFAVLNDSLFIGGSEGSIKILNKQFELLSQIVKPRDFLTFKIYRDKKKQLWLGTNFGLKVLSASSANRQAPIYTLSLPPFKIPLLEKDVVNDIMEDEEGNLWIGSSNGLFKVAPDRRWQMFTEKSGLPSANITCIFQDREKNIWIGTALGVAKLVTKNNIRVYTKEDSLLSNNTKDLIALKKDLLQIITEKGIQNFDVASQRFMMVRSENDKLYNGFVKNSQPLLFYQNNNAFGKYNYSKERLEDYILPSSPNVETYFSIIDDRGIIFNGTQNGLIIRTGNKSYFEKKISSRITALLIDKKGFLWAGTWDKGLYRIHYSSNNVDNINISVEDFSWLLPDKNIRSIFEDSKKNIWIGTRYRGLVQLSNKKDKPEVIQNFDSQTGLMSNFIRAIAEDDNGCIWVGSDLGIDKLILNANAFRVFNFSRISNYFSSINNILPQKDNSLWLSTSEGLVNIIDGKSEKIAAFPVYITAVKLSDAAFNFSNYLPDKKVQLKYNTNQAEFEFSATSFINEKQVLYSYRLMGSTNASWSKPGNQHEVSYASLQPGNYTFEVRTFGWNGKWGAPATFSFIINAPYWQTWWFYSIIGILVLLLFYGIYLNRIRQLLKLQKVRNRIASDLHDDIGSTLTNINILTEISRKNLDHPREAEKFLKRIAEDVTATSEALNDIIWSVNTSNDSMEEMLSRIRRYAADLFDNCNVICHLDMDEKIGGKKMSMELRRDVYLICKECMNNMVKHAAAGNVWIQVIFYRNKLQLNFKDDGKGFDATVITSRNGLKNIRARTKRWKGQVKIQTGGGNGTAIEISLPMEN